MAWFTHELHRLLCVFIKSLDDLEQYIDLDISSGNRWNNFEINLGEFDRKIFYDSHNFLDITEEWT